MIRISLLWLVYSGTRDGVTQAIDTVFEMRNTLEERAEANRGILHTGHSKQQS
jgi:hypothetical protein